MFRIGKEEIDAVARAIYSKDFFKINGSGQEVLNFENELKVTIQALGWKPGHRYRPLQDDISSVAYWYQDSVFTDFPELPDADELEMN